MTQASACLECPERFYCVPEEVIEGNSSSGYTKCPQGFYCPNGTGRVWQPCPPGTFSDVEGLAYETECQQCTGGKYCDVSNLTAPVGDCSAGHYCTIGVNVAAPDGTSNTGTGAPCPQGSYCQPGSVMPTGCAAGTYQNLEGQDSCVVCPEGYYCPENSTDYSDKPCPAGHYCLSGTQSDTQYPCTMGTFNNATGGHNSSSCAQCTPGYYCELPGLSSPTTECDPGWYCTLGSFLAQPSSPEGGKCLAGTYCPQGSSAPIGCDPGSYCATDMLSAVTGLCDAGYYCTDNSTTKTPTGTGGDECPPGHHCVQGSSSPTPCLPGFFNPSKLAQDSSYCIACTAGYYCNASGLSAVDGPCDAGYYCPAGQSSRNPSAFECPSGYRCPQGSSLPQICPSGYYQDETGQETCKECPAGFYCDNSLGNITSYTIFPCPTGHYCLAGTQYEYEHPCPAGTYNDQLGLTMESECQGCIGGHYCTSGTTTPTLTCNAGFYCRNGSQSGSPMQDTDAYECPVGHYCPANTSEPIKCPTGTFSNAVRLTQVSECTDCTQGFYCAEEGLTAVTGPCAAGYYCVAGSDNDAPAICPQGRYCPEGTHTPPKCPSGTFSNSTGLSNETECTICTAGYYCTTSGITDVQGPCTAGYYCPEGSTIATTVVCPIAYHCPEASPAPVECPGGTYTTQTLQSVCANCPATYYCVPDSVVAGDVSSVRFDCPSGYYCPEGTGWDWSPCPKGTYSTKSKLSVYTQCTDCDAGKYCSQEGATAVTGPCNAGHWCQNGVDRPNPDKDAVVGGNETCPFLGGHTGEGSLCPAGSFCLEGSELPEECPAGTYQDQTGQDFCKACPEGYYCPVNTTDYSDKPCPTGHYCPENTTAADNNECPTGTYNPNEKQTNSSACLDCPGGQYCDSEGLSAPTGNCSGGYYCSGGAIKADPTSASHGGGKCDQGYYCPEGSSDMVECDGGKYCIRGRLSEPTGNCTAGYYCTLKANYHSPFDNITGYSCPRGHYCPVASKEGTPCPMGYYLDSERNTQLSDCKICPLGKYCNGPGLAEPTGDCAPGYYCPVGQIEATPAAYNCSVGHFCVGGGDTEEACPSGSYQDLPTQPDCKPCPPGYYCSATSGPVTWYGSFVCPEGSYCPEGTEYDTQYPCPFGTYNNITGLTHVDNCTSCVGGMACDQIGLTYPLRPCSAGYFCMTGAQSTTPTEGANADACPEGYYCPEGTAEPVACPEGSYNPVTLLQMESECLNCTGGYFCNETGLTDVVGQCSAGHYCPVGSIQPTEEQCTVGHYCEVGTEFPTPCPNGTFSNTLGLMASTDCTPCTEGYFCNGEGLTAVSGDCKQGYYCPTGSSVESDTICPIGKHCPTQSVEPQDCGAGTYTDYEGAWECDICPEGFYCVPDLVVAGDISSVMTDCPEGYFCPNGTGYDWQGCPAGTFSNVAGLTKASECTPCTGGQFCQGTNLTEPSGLCDPGFYCSSGADRSNPLMLSSSQCPTGTVHPIIGHECPTGSYCPEGSDLPIGCPAGTYQDLTNQDHCKGCVAGYYCEANTTDYLAYVCPQGYYCPENTTHAHEYPCPPKTFNSLTEGKSLADCSICTAGMYCEGSGNTEPTGNCSAGYYCTNGSDTNMPVTAGGICRAGNYCPAGATAEILCTAGQYCSIDGLALPEGDCDEGYYCPLGSVSQQELPCPVGFFCPTGTGDPQPCRNGTYAPTTRLKSEGECTPCDAGSYCNGTGLSAVSGPCDPGFYCPAGQTQPNPYDYRCTPGHYCVANSANEVICDNGKYQNEYQQSDCKDCPAGYFCDNSYGAIGNLTGYECPTGYYCPGSVERSNEYPCPAGTYNNRTMLSNSTECQACTPGFFCKNSGLSEPQGLCYPGFYCNGSTVDGNPSYAQCPIGNYCPEGSYQPIPCPSGTIATGVGNDNLTDCEPCKPGNYCTASASQNGYSLECSAGYICLTGSDIPNPTDNVIGYVCPMGYYCPQGAVIELQCDLGYYSPTTGLGECKECEPGTSCPMLGMNATLPCPAGYYCLNGTRDDGEPCPIGTYSPHESVDSPENCLACLPGQYCEVSGLSAPTGNCSAGYLCLGNASSPTPDDGVNELCPIAHYCVEGTTAAVPCPVGTMRNETGGTSVDDCYPCTGGFYCDQLAAIEPAGPCAERFYCPSTADISDPSPALYKCPTGFYCPANSAEPVPCPPGTYQPAEAEVFCEPCPSGFYCVQNTTFPDPCPPFSYCPEYTSDPILCPNGTYTDSSTFGLEKAEDCPSCVAGKYCIGGVIAGDCHAGFLCLGGQGQPDPDDSFLPLGGLCPYGYYCPNGTTFPQVCPTLKFINKVGAASVTECQVCPGGSICPENSTVAEPCYAGWYCPVNVAPTKCNLTTYNALQGASDVSWCLPCPGGYYCDEEGIADYTTKPCPLGFYCVNATTTPTPCPPGTYRDLVIAASVEDCTLCPAGRYCPDFNMTYDGIDCPDGTVCEEGASIVRICPAGYYCTNAEMQLSCPPAYYCPENSTSPTPCPIGHYCTGTYFDTCNCTDAGAIEPVQCPRGYGDMPGAERKTLEDTCEPCRAGNYSAEDGSGCLYCRAGVVCLDYATTDNPVTNSSDLADIFGPNGTQSFLCPAGYYCPEGSGEATPCPIGTANPNEGMGSVSDCIDCPVDHFNHLTGQIGCFPCGSEAEQPYRGQRTCSCTGAGRDFQESDRQCPCAAGFRNNEGDRDCVKRVFPLCRKWEWRYQDGSCFTGEQFEDHCRNNVCDDGEYEGYLETKGSCLCEAEDLPVLCDLECRIAQENTISFTCASPPIEPYLAIRDTDGTVLKEFVSSATTSLITSRNTFTKSQCSSLDNTQHPVPLLTVDEVTKGFVGVYNPDPPTLVTLFDNNIKASISGSASNDSISSFIGRRRLLSTGTFNGTTFSGVKNPVICLENGQFMLFAVTNSIYPIYDIDNLYNTNSNFDYGGFRALAEAQAQVGTSTQLFAYQFNDAGSYVFKSSADEYKKIYIRVMQPNTQCTNTGPFFPATTSNIVANGISISQDILQQPDWAVIFALLGACVLVMVLMILALVLFRKYGWMKSSYLFPFYRIVTSRYNFDDYASKGSTVYPVRKYHRNMHALQGAAPPYQPPAIDNGGVIEQQDDDFWDYDKQVDLEGFSSKTVYDTLAKQSRDVTQTIGKQKDEVKQMYQNISNQTDSLKGLWAAKMNLKGTAVLATDDDLASYDRKLDYLERELARRKEVGRQFETVLNRQLDIADNDEKCREEHQVSYQAGLREGIRILKEHTEAMQRGQLVKDGQFDHTAHKAMEAKVSGLIHKMSGDLSDESRRLGCWGVLGQGTGGQLVKPGSKEPASREDLFGKSNSLVETDKATGLMKARHGSHMITADGNIRAVPADCFVHPQTGHCLPIAGNVAFDPVTSRLVFVTDSATSEAPKSEDPYIPFVPYPHHNGQPVRTKLKPLQHAGDMKYGGPMSDPETGLHVPILACTLQPQTGALLPVGGTHIDAVTGLPTPIEVGSIMVDPNSEQPVPILAVSIDQETGDVVPVGGTKLDGTPIIPGDTITEPLSGKSVRVRSGLLRGVNVQASAGSYQGLLDSNVMACEARVNDALREYKETLAGSTDGSVNIRHEEATLEAAVKELTRARTKMKIHLLRSQQDVKRRLDRANILATTGGSPGMYEFAKTGQLLPILVGTPMTDPSGSGQEVPILGAERDRNTAKIIPLGGTMEDPEGAGLTPISIGKKAIDPVSGELSPVIGVRTNPETNTVVPVTLSSAAHRKRTPPPGAIAMLEEEIVARRSFWRRQRQKEEELTSAEHKLALTLIHDMDNVTVKSVEKALEEIDAGANTIAESGKREVQRRGAAEQEYGNVLPPEVIAVLTDADMRECEKEEGHVAAHVKFADSIRKFFNKLQQEEKKYKDKMGSFDDHGNADGDNAVLMRYRQAKDRLLAELQGQIVTRMEHLDSAHSALEYARERAELCCQEAKVALTHSSLLAGDYDARLTGVYGDADSTASQDSELVPLLKQLIALLESGGPFYLSTELLNLINSAAGGRTSQQTTNINIGGQQDYLNKFGKGGEFDSRDEDKSGKGKDKGKEPKVAAAALVKSSTKKGKGDKSKGTGTESQDEARKGESWKDLIRRLFERQAYEAAKLENDLKSEEVTSMQDTIEEFEKKKRNMMNEAREDLRQKLEKVDNQKEKDRLMAEYAVNLQKVNDAFDKQKQQQLESLRKRLLEERRNKKKALYRKQCEEAQAQGVGIDKVPDVNLPGYDDLMRDLMKLQENQERALAEMQYQGEQAKDQVQVDEIDPEFEKRIKALDVDKSVKDEMINKARARNKDLQNQIKHLKDMLARRKDRMRPVKLTDEEEQGLSREEQQRLIDARELQTESDRKREDQALIDARRLIEKEQQRLDQEQALRDMLRNKSEEERDRILAQFQGELDRLMNRQEDQKQTQRDKIIGKLAARKRLREEMEKEQAVAKELDRITKRHVAQGDSDAADVIMSINDKVNNDKMTPEQERLLNQQTQDTESLEERQLKEKREMNRNLDDEMATEEIGLGTQIQQQKRLALAEHKNKFERDMLLNRQNMSDDEYKRLLKEHEREMAALNQNLEAEKDRQKRIIADKILERRKKRDAQLEEKHRLEMEEEMTRQQQERDKLKEEIARKVEDQELKKNTKNIKGEKAENLIYTVLRQRHLKEAIHLEDQLAREMAAARRRAKAEVEQSRQKDREMLLNAFEQEMIDLVANSKGMSNEELTARKQELKKQQKKQRKEFDKLTAQLAEQAEKDMLPKLEVQQTYQRLDMKTKQLNELADAMKTYSPSEEIAKKYAEEARMAALEAQKFKDEVLRRIEQEMERLKKLEREKEEEKKRKLAEHYQKLERDLEEEQKREEQRLKEREMEKQRLKQKQLEERRKNQEEDIKKSNMSEDEKNRLLREHNENMEKLEENFREEQERTKASLAAKLEARKKKRHGAEYAKLTKHMQLESDREQQKNLAQKEQERALMGEDSNLKTETSNVLIGELPSGGGAPRPPSTAESSGGSGLGFTPTGNVEQDWVNLLMLSPLFKQINDLEEMLEKSDLSSDQPAKPHVKGADYSHPYIDVKDAQWACKGDLVPADVKNITPSQFVVYRFGVFVIKLLNQSIGTPEVTLLLASNLPPNNYERNAFRNSIFYEHAKRILFVRKERIDSIGEFVVLILHAMSHIKIGEMTDDGNALFLRQFYRCLKVVCQDMFFSRSRNTATTHSLIGSPSANSRPALEQALAPLAKKPEDKTNVVDELVDMNVAEPTRTDFSSQRMNQRMYGYDNMASNARLRQYLAAKGGYLATSDFIASRLAELKGSSPTSTPKSSPQRRMLQQIKSPKDVVDTQLVTLQSKNDILNEELTDMIKTETELREGLRNSEGDQLKHRSVQEQLNALLTRKNEMLKRISAIENDISAKEKELKSKR